MAIDDPRIQAFKLAADNYDFTFIVDVPAIRARGDSGVPDMVLRQFPTLLLLQMDIRQRAADQILYTEEGFSVNLNFSVPCRCAFLWTDLRNLTIMFGKGKTGTTSGVEIPARTVEKGMN